MANKRLAQIVGVANARDDSNPILSRDALELIRARAAGGTFDEVDMLALIEHADAVTDRYEDLVQLHAQEADRAQELLSDKEIIIMGQQERLNRISICIRDARALFPELMLNASIAYRLAIGEPDYEIVESTGAADAAGATE